VLAQGDDVVAIPGTRSMARLEENLGALRVALSSEEAACISEAIPRGAAAGARYPAAAMEAVYR
jgi:aryl-alcohol dehydrogenase-like predicted oxidoreductase